MGRCSTPEELQQFLDDRLDALETEVIAAHLEDCAACRNVLEQITSVRYRATATGAIGLSSRQRAGSTPF